MNRATDQFPIITGVGLTTPLGATLGETWQALCEGQVIRDHARAAGSGETAGRFFDLAEVAAREAMGHAEWEAGGSSDVALVFGTSKGPIETWLPGASDIDETPCVSAGESHHPGNCPLRSFGLSGAASALANRLGLAGPRLTVSAACASGLHALIRAALMIRCGEARRVLVVAAEASVHPLFLGSFQRLGVLPPEGVGCRPFDQHRAGFLMSEAAAAVCLEAGTGTDEERAPRHAPIRLDRFAFAGDATHLTGADPNAETLRGLLSHVVDARPVDLIHAHGTGTLLNDPVELAAIESVVATVVAPSGEPRPPSLYSHKGALGHSLGAAGLVSIVLNWMAHRQGLIPANVQTRRPLPTTKVHLAQDVIHRPVRRSVAIAAGFGGQMAVVGLKSGDGNPR